MFNIDYRSSKPLYQQIVDNIEQMTVRGILAPESRLPSVRSLAVELSINPNTIQKAYGELESRGVIYTVQGRGAFISGESEKLLLKKREELLRRITRLAEEAKQLGISQSDLIACCNRWYINAGMVEGGDSK